MDYRIGKCSQCGAEYKIPSGFAHDRARCKQCQGVVEIAPLGAKPEEASAAPAPPKPTAIPARKVVPAPAAARPEPPARVHAAPAPASPPRGSPSSRPAEDEGPRKGGTLERLKAQRRAEAETKVEAASAPPARSVPEAPRTPTPEPGPTARSARPSARKTAPSASKTERASRSGGRSGRATPQKKKTPVVGLVSILGLALLGGGAFLFRDSLFGSSQGSEVAAASDETQEPVVVQTPIRVEPEEVPEAEPSTPEESEKPKVPKSRDPASIDLAGMPDLDKTPDTTDEEWAAMQEQMAQWMDRDAGASANRSKIALQAQGRKAMPIILNFFKKLDFATSDGRANGDQCQKTLKDICNGTNFDWKYAAPDEGRPYDNPDDVWFCKRVVELWVNSWKQGETNIEAWIKMAKLDDKSPEEAARLRTEFGNKTATGESADPVATGGDDDLDVD